MNDFIPEEPRIEELTGTESGARPIYYGPESRPEAVQKNLQDLRIMLALDTENKNPHEEIVIKSISIVSSQHERLQAFSIECEDYDSARKLGSKLTMLANQSNTRFKLSANNAFEGVNRHSAHAEAHATGRIVHACFPKDRAVVELLRAKMQELHPEIASEKQF